MPGLVNSVRKDNFVTYGLNSRALDLFFAEDNDEMFQVVAEFIPCNLLIDGEINGDAAYYYDGTVRKGGADWEHSMVACLVANEYDTLTGCFRSGGDIRRFFAELFKNCPRSTELEKTYRRLLPKMQSLVATEGKLSADRAIALIPAHNESAFANCKVVGVIDGDTINVVADGRQVKVRLSKIDAPEKSQGYGQAAKQHLSNMVYGKHVRIVYAHSFTTIATVPYGRCWPESLFKILSAGIKHRPEGRFARFAVPKRRFKQNEGYAEWLRVKAVVVERATRRVVSAEGSAGPFASDAALQAYLDFLRGDDGFALVKQG